MIQWGWRGSHADHVCYLDDDWRCHAWTGPGNMKNHESFGNKTLLSANLYLFWSCCFGYGGYTFLGYDYPELYGANAQNTYRRIHKSYCSRLIHTKMLLSGIFGTDWVASAWSLICFESHESFVCFVCHVCQVCQCLSWKTYTCWKKQNLKSEIWNQTAYTLCNLLNNTTSMRLKNKILMDAN